jgi:hypothetical protein
MFLAVEFGPIGKNDHNSRIDFKGDYTIQVGKLRQSPANLAQPTQPT